MKVRNATKRLSAVSPAQFEDAMAKYAAAEQRQAEINKCIETEVNDVLHTYEEELTCLNQGKAIAFEMVQSYCLEHKQKLFNNRRSIGTLQGIAGFRLGTPRLKTEKGTNWEGILAQLKQILPAYVRTIHEPAKDLLLADRHKEHVAPVLVKLGLQVVQDELFYIETKKAA